MAEIPIVDFEKCSLGKQLPENCICKNVGKSIYEAFATVGFVYLRNTGITESDVNDVNSVTNRFFKLDASLKTKWARTPNNHGYVGTDEESLNPKRVGDYKEAFNISSDALADDSTSWPDEYVPGFSNIMIQFSGTCRLLSERLLKVLSLGMEMKDPDFLHRCHSRMNGKDNFTTLRSLHYPPIPDSMEMKPGQIRCGEHSDYGSFTLLFQDEIGGLQVASYTGEYIEAVPIRGTVLVNIGDILQFWTGGRLKSTRHRVLMPDIASARNVDRRSLAYFVHPDHEIMLSSMEYGASSSVEHHESMKPEYEQPVTAYQHVTRRFDASYVS